jgi:phosphatidylinositol glycan class M
LGKLVVVGFTLGVSIVLQSFAVSFWLPHLLWTLNPFVLSITTRGSPEAIIAFFVVANLASIKNTKAGWKSEAVAAILLALSMSYKIYPIIFVPAFWTFLKRDHGWFGWGVWRFGIITLMSFVGINFGLWSM